jgi:hypothetical protein
MHIVCPCGPSREPRAESIPMMGLRLDFALEFHRPASRSTCGHLANDWIDAGQAWSPTWAYVEEFVGLDSGVITGTSMYPLIAHFRGS